MSAVIARPPTASELDQAAYVAQVAFDTPEIDSWVRSHNWIAENHGLEYIMVVEQDRRIVASLICTPGEAYFGEDIVSLSAVGAVATLPEYRKVGCAAAMMQEVVRLFLRRNIHTSALWPFSYHYYRKFGWEIGGEHVSYSMTREFASTLGHTGRVRPAWERDLPGISILVARFAEARNCVTVRTPEWWNCLSSVYNMRLDGEDDLRKSCSPWVHETSGKIDGYAFFLIEGEGENEVVKIKELVADTREARNALLSKFAEAGAPRIHFPAPRDDQFLQELSNPRDVIAEISGSFQFRVINPPAALEMRSVDPKISGRLGFSISDPVLDPWDFDIEVDSGRILMGNSTAKERLTMNVQTFAQLYSGYVSPTRAAELGRLKATSQTALDFADSILQGRTPYRAWMELG